MTTAYIEITDWKGYQHYKDRDPPWIKLHRKLLDNYEFSRLQDASKAHLMGLWLLAARHGNKIPADAEWIAQRIGATSPVDLQALASAGLITIHGAVVQDASNPLAKCSTEAERETEVETTSSSSAPAPEKPPPEKPHADQQRLNMLARFEFDDGNTVSEFLDAVDPTRRAAWVGKLDMWSQGYDLPPAPPKVKPPDIARGLGDYLAGEEHRSFNVNRVKGYVVSAARARENPPETGAGPPHSNGAPGNRRPSLMERNIANAIAAAHLPPLPGDG